MWLRHRIAIGTCVVFCGIMLIDWLLQYLNILPSNNRRRLFTGIICGIGYIQLFAYLMNVAAQFIRTILAH